MPLQGCCPPAKLGPVDREMIVAVIGAWAARLRTIGRESRDPVGLLSCELAVRKEQKPCSLGRYELLTSCDDEQWVRSVVSDIGRMTFETKFGDGHTMDIGSWVGPGAALQGVVFETVCVCRIRLRSYGVLRVIGISRPEMEYAHDLGAPALLERLRTAGVYPNTMINRRSVV